MERRMQLILALKLIELAMRDAPEEMLEIMARELDLATLRILEQVPTS